MLGQQMTTGVVAVAGTISEAGARRLTEMVIEWIGMRTSWRSACGVVHRLEPHTWHFPVGDNLGGEGETKITPCFTFVQPLIESYSTILPGVVGLDTWKEFPHFYIIINSCRDFRITRVVRRLEKLGWKVLDYGYMRVAAKERKTGWLRRVLNAVIGLIE